MSASCYQTLHSEIGRRRREHASELGSLLLGDLRPRLSGLKGEGPLMVPTRFALSALAGSISRTVSCKRTSRSRTRKTGSDHLIYTGVRSAVVRGRLPCCLVDLEVTINLIQMDATPVVLQVLAQPGAAGTPSLNAEELVSPVLGAVFVRGNDPDVPSVPETELSPIVDGGDEDIDVCHAAILRERRVLCPVRHLRPRCIALYPPMPYSPNRTPT